MSPPSIIGQNGLTLAANMRLFTDGYGLLQVVDISYPTQPAAVITHTLPGSTGQFPLLG